MNLHPSLRRAALLCVLGSASALSVYGKDSWSDPFAGVRLLHRSTDDPKWDFYLAIIDLTEPGVRLIATPPEERRSTASSFAKKKKVQIAINGDFFSYKDYSTGGLSIGEGKAWPGTADSKSRGVLAAGTGRVELIDQKVVVKPEPWMQCAVSGHSQLLDDGEPFETKDGVLGPRHPRTAVGMSKDRKTLLLLVVDGRQKHSVGMTGKEMQKVFLEFGAWEALNLDGGGSSTMVVDGKVVNKPSDGRERTTGNQLGVYAPPAAPRTKGLVKGVVKDKSTGQPLPGAKVALSSAYVDETTAKGYYEFSQVPAGQPQLTVTLDGYETAKPRVKVEAQQTAVLDIELVPKPKPPDKTAATPAAEPGNGSTSLTTRRGDAAAAPPAASGGEEADRLLSRGRNYENGKLWGKALEAYQEVVKQFPGTAQAEAADERILAVEEVLGEPSSDR